MQPDINLAITGTFARIRPWLKTLQTFPHIQLRGYHSEAPDPSAALPYYDTLTSLLKEAQILLVLSSPGKRYSEISQALREGIQVWTTWPPVLSLKEAQKVQHLVEEAHIEPALLMPYRHHPALATYPSSSSYRLLLHTWQLDASFEKLVPFPWHHLLAIALDLCMALSQSRYIRSSDIESGASLQATPLTSAFHFRSHHGVYVHSTLQRLHPSASHQIVLEDHVQRYTYTLDPPPSNDPKEKSYDQTSILYPDALRRAAVEDTLSRSLQKKWPRVSWTDGITLMRMVEHLTQKLRF